MKSQNVVFVVVIVCAIAICGIVKSAVCEPPGELDSIWVHVAEATEQQKTAEGFDLSLKWEVFVKKATDRRGYKFASDWTSLPTEDIDYTFVIEVASDSNFNNIITREETQELSFVLSNLPYQQFFVCRVDIADPPLNYRSDFASGKIYKHEKAAAGKAQEKNLFYWVGFYLEYGGWQTYFIILFGIVGIFIVWPLTWWKLRLASVFPPNKSGFLYSALPFDRNGKTSHISEKGNVFIREVAKYWSRAMAAMVQDPAYWENTEDFVKSTQQEHEEIKRRLWVEEGLPAIEQAIDICKNGVPGIKLNKKPLEYPFPRVLLAALENQRANRNNWWASQEMDRATENTAYKEIDDLKSWTVSAFWALGSIEPMLGLFGTVQGIQKAFMGIQEQLKENPDAPMAETVEKLAGGIQQALITTILGLMFGIPFMLMYYYYRGKADFIFSKWEEIVIEILNRA